MARLLPRNVDNSDTASDPLPTVRGMSFRIAQYNALEACDGARRGVIHHWRGQEESTGRTVMLALLPQVPAETVHRMAVRARAAEHQHLLRELGVAHDGDRIAVVAPWPAGGRLSELLDRRGRLTPAETLTVLRPLASTLEAIHERGLAHGNLASESVWFDADGRPLLGGLATGLAVASAAAEELAPPAAPADLAPEVARGASPSAASDMFSLGSVGLACLTGRTAWPADDAADVVVQSAAGLWPDLADDAGPTALVGVIRALLDPDPDARPDPSVVAAELRSAGRPAPIDFDAESVPPLPPPHRTADQPTEWDALGLGREPTDGPSGERMRRGGRRPHVATARLARAGLLGFAIILVAVLAIQAGLWWARIDQPSAGLLPAEATAAAPARPAGSAPRTQSDWLDVVRGLDASRAVALATPDESLLAQVYVEGSAALASDTGLVAELAGRGLRIDGGTHQVLDVRILERSPGYGPAVPDDSAPGTAASPGAAVPSDDAGLPGAGAPSDGAAPATEVSVAVTDSLPAHRVLDAHGQQVGTTPARERQQRILHLRLTDDGYRIASIEPT